MSRRSLYLLIAPALIVLVLVAINVAGLMAGNTATLNDSDLTTTDQNATPPPVPASLQQSPFADSLGALAAAHAAQVAAVSLTDYRDSTQAEIAALQNLSTELVAATTSSQTLKNLVNYLGSYSDTTDSLQNSLIARYQQQKSINTDLMHGNTSMLIQKGGDRYITTLISIDSFIDLTKFYYASTLTQAALADTTHRDLALVQSSCDTYDGKSSITASAGLPSNSLMNLFTHNILGTLAFHLTTQTMSGSYKTLACVADTALRGVRLVAAVKAWEQDNGAPIPPTLDVLVPTYVAMLPPDPFSGQAFKLDPIKRIIYSVGPGRTDVGGMLGDWTQTVNPTFILAPWAPHV